MRGVRDNMKRKILVVDDQAGIRLLLKDIFSSQGYNVILAEDGMEALKVIHNEEFDLVVLDYHMPFLNGLKVLDKMRIASVTTPVILMSGTIENFPEEKLKLYNKVEIIAKPFNILEICELVESIVEVS